MPKLHRPSPAMVVATLALVAGSSGTSFAVTQLSKNSVKTGHIASGQVKWSDLGKSAVTSSRVKDGTLYAKDFAKGQLPKAQQGPQGPQGVPGAPGQPGEKGEKGDKGDSGVTNVVVRRVTLTVPATGKKGGYAVCQAGERLTGGGVGFLGGADTSNYVSDSGPVDSNGGNFSDTETGDEPRAWYGTLRNTSGADRTGYVWAICAS